MAKSVGKGKFRPDPKPLNRCWWNSNLRTTSRRPPSCNSANTQFSIVHLASFFVFFGFFVTRTFRTGGPILTIYRVAQKFGTIILYALTLPNINRFSKLFHYQNQEKICNNTITKDPTTPQVCRYTTLWNVKCLKSYNWKQDDFCINTF